jgi:hypothetical protein
MGLIATNTIAQGDTRATGLKSLVARGFHIYDATPTMAWPGAAAVTVSVVHLALGAPASRVSERHLDRALVPAINSRLRGKPERADAMTLVANAGNSFLGCKVYGQGFLLTPDERAALVATDPRNLERILPYLGGQEFNTSPTQSHERYVISFGEMSLEEAEGWPELIATVREKVKPERDKLKNNADGRRRKQFWWQFGRWTPALFESIAPLDRCLVTSAISKHRMFAFAAVDQVFSHNTYVFPLRGFTSLAVLQSRVHVVWADLLSSGLEDRGGYRPSDCFETFPFPESDPRTVIGALESAGEQLCETRAAYMVETGQGLTKTYNALKDPGNDEPRVVELRCLHEEMERAVLSAYGWGDIAVPPYCARTDEDWSAFQEFEDEVIDRLYVLNAERVRKEELLGLATRGKTAGKNRAKKTGKAATATAPKSSRSNQGDLF